MAHLLIKQSLDFTDARVKDTALFMIPNVLIVGVEDGSIREILDAAYLIQYPFIDGFGFIKGDYFNLSNGFNLIRFSVALRSKFRVLPLRKQPKITVSFWIPPMPFISDSNSQSSTSANTTTVQASITSVSLLAANASRKGLTIYNNSSLGTLYVGFGATVSAANFAVKINPNTTWECPEDYDGMVTGIWSSASGSAQITEFI